MVVGLTEYFIISLAAIFVIVNPLTTAFVFLSLLPRATRKTRKKIALQGCYTALSILIIFALVGGFIFKLFSVSLGAFRIAGGIILLLIAVRMVLSHTGEHDEHALDEEDFGKEIAIIPLAIPFMSGPGAIATVMLLTNEAPSPLHIFFVLLAAAVVITACYFALVYAEAVVNILGNTGKRVVTRLFGIILLVIAIQFIINGTIDTIPVFKAAL